jgi:hypothetical protein
MPSNIILECSERTGVNEDKSNAVWVSSFSEPVSIEDGDVIQLNQAILNTQNVSGGGITLSEDTTVIIQVCYYENALCQIPLTTKSLLPFGDQDYQNISQWNSEGTKADPVPQSHVYEATFKDNKKPCGFYLCRRGDTVTSELLTHEIEVLIPAGTYDPGSIAELITSGVDKSVDFTILDGAGGKGGTMIDMTFDPDLHMNIVNGKDHSYEGHTNAVTSYQNDGFIIDSTEGAGTETNNHYVGQHILRYIGASAFSIEYADGRFSFTNMHSPVFGDTAGGTYTDPSIGLVVLGTTTDYSKQFFRVGCIGGCMITDLKPRSFWNKLARVQ